MNISVYGAGYVGLVSAACFAKLGHEVTCVDVDKQRIASLSRGECPIHELKLPALLQQQKIAGRLHFTVDASLAIKNASIHLIATGTPSLADGSADLSQVYAVVAQIAAEAKADCVIAIKSTVPVGSGDLIQNQVNDELLRTGKNLKIILTANPEFLREGSAVDDFLQADRIIIGGDDQQALSDLKALYQPLVDQGIPLLSMSRSSAELAKYAANAMLASKISLMNQLSRVAEEFNANIDDLKEAMGLDHRIGPYFLEAGIGYGGSCFPKDLRALAQMAKAAGINSCLFDAIEQMNQLQKNWVVEQLAEYFSNQIADLTIGIWGLAFKPGTDDLREASSLVTMRWLLEAGAKLAVFDPAAMRNARELFADHLAISWCDSAESVLESNLDALVIMTEWPEFKAYDLNYLQRKLQKAPLIDGRNCFELLKVRDAQFSFYYSVGRPVVGYTI